MQNSQNLSITLPSLPEGGGSLRGMGEALTVTGTNGSVALSLPLPVSAGRGVAPSMALNYASTAGNGPFGISWLCEPPSINVRTALGVPKYEGNDSFLAPSGEVLEIAINSQGNQDIRKETTLRGTQLSQSHTVTRYQPRIMDDFSLLEHWQPAQTGSDQPFWVMYTTDGQIHLFGKNKQARISNAQDDAEIARWLLEESMTPTGEHIFYYYQSEDDKGCSDEEKQQHPNVASQRYLAKVSYGNIQPETTFYALKSATPADNLWLFYLVFDYGSRSLSLSEVPAFSSTAAWQCRPDCFSRYEYGFEVRTRRLCYQVLMFHRVWTLAGESVSGEVPALISRLILNYDLDGRVSTLVSARSLAHEQNGQAVTLAPLELDYQRPDNNALNFTWQPAPNLHLYNELQPYQLVDLYGEGITGILYQDLPGAWWYRSPIRDTESDDPNAVTYDTMTALPQIPSQQDNAVLMDINGDGRLDWLVTATGLHGYHTMNPEHQWTPFIPLSTLPIEYFHPAAQLADLTGDGLPDLAMIGPQSVRFWTNNREGWETGEEVIYPSNSPLPVPGRDERKLVAFSDMLGSGQSHLVEVTAAKVRCWPNLGHGRFGAPLTLTGFSQPAALFNPAQLYMADIDGSGTTDLIYAHSDYLEIYFNESGNRFREPLRVDLPTGVRNDRTCRLQLADTQGLGVPSITLTVPHIAPHHWRLELLQHKPWLLNASNNNMGSDTLITYRSSAQFWLDEKLRAQTEGYTAYSYLPFPVHMLWKTNALDEITGNRLSSIYDYAHGAWDGQEREFRGFGRMTQTDIDIQSIGTTDANTPIPTRTINWFSTGVKEVDEQLPNEYWKGDSQAFASFSPRFTRYDSATETDVVIIPTEKETYWLTRALKGQLLRSELYGDDGSELATIPYAVTESRAQVRRLLDDALSVWVSTIESRSWQYERIAIDPQCSQQVVLKNDRYGFPCDTVTVAYPRRAKPSTSPYPDTLPPTLFDSSYDDQQNVLRLTRQRASWHHLTESGAWYLGLSDVSRQDAKVYAASVVPKQGVSLEWLQNSVQLPEAEDDYLGHQRIAWNGANEKPAIPPLVTYTETAEFDSKSLSAFDGVLSAEELESYLTQAGWLKASAPMTSGAGFTVRVGRTGFTDYAGAAGFYRPLAQRTTQLTGKTTLKWDTHYCAITETVDAAGFTMKAKYDYRFMSPNDITDINDNRHIATFDALGRLTSTRFSGTENGVMQGYTQPEDEKTPFVLPTMVDAALALTSGIPVASLVVYDPLSWMPTVKSEDDTLMKHGVLTEDNRLCQLAQRRWQQRNPSSNALLKAQPGTPPHMLTIITDRYDKDPEQQLRQSIVLSDGFGRALQTAMRHESGEAWQRSVNGALVTGSDGKPQSAETNFRWAVSGRVEYDSKGQPIRAYQPYFLNSWKYVSDDSARQDLYSDTNFYDALNRLVKVKTAKGYLRRSLFTPWFVVNEDENDTAAEAIAQ